MTEGLIYPSTRQDPQKMGIFFKEIRQNSVRGMAGIRQAERFAAGFGMATIKSQRLTPLLLPFRASVLHFQKTCYLFRWPGVQ